MFVLLIYCKFSDDKKHLEDKKKPGELNFTFKDASVGMNIEY